MVVERERGTDQVTHGEGGLEGDRKEKKVCVLVREHHRQPDGGAVKTSFIPSLSCRRGTEDPHAPVVTRSLLSQLHPTPVPLPNPFCVRLASATPQEFFPHPRREREREGGKVEVEEGGWKAAAGQLQGGDETRPRRIGEESGGGGVRSSEALRCLPGSFPLRGSLSREPCPKSLAPGGRRTIVRRWPLQAGPPAATAAASWPLPPPLHLQDRDNAPSGWDVVGVTPLSPGVLRVWRPTALKRT